MESNLRLTQVAEAIEGLGMWLRRKAPSEVNTTTVTTLDTLLADGPARISDLAGREAISQPGMTTLVNRLEAAGLAERVPDPTDGRAVLVRITDGGRRLLANRRADRTAALLVEFDRLDEADCAALMAALPAIEQLITTTTTANKKKVS